MNLSDFDYNLPEELIAQHPTKKRDCSRLLVMDRKSGGIKHHTFYEIFDLLNPNDLLILNNSKVFPARLIGERSDTGGKIELLLNHQIDENYWETIGKGLKSGIEINFGNSVMTAKVEDAASLTDGVSAEAGTPASEGMRGKKYDEFILSFSYSGGQFWQEINKIGLIPLPPYIHRPLKNSEEDKERYQTVYAKKSGSVAAPTAGLHFTPELLDKIQAKGIDVQYLTLHVGLGTFLPVKTERIEDHKMHEEYFELKKELLEKIELTKKRGGRIITVGTTTTRVLEAIYSNQAEVLSETDKEILGRTKIFIYPSFKFKCIDALITNFHLPKSTLLMLVSAFAGREKILNTYQSAIAEQYRFFSYGDAMFIADSNHLC